MRMHMRMHTRMHTRNSLCMQKSVRMRITCWYVDGALRAGVYAQ